MNLRPLHDRVVVQRIEDPAQPVGAMIIPDSAKEKTVFDRRAGQEMKHQGIEYLILRVDEVLGAMEGLTKSTDIRE